MWTAQGAGAWIKSLDAKTANLQNDAVVFDICDEESAETYLTANC